MTSSNSSAGYDVFDYPVAQRTDQFDRMASALDSLTIACHQLEDWTGWYIEPTFIPLRIPVHDPPMAALNG